MTWLHRLNVALCLVAAAVLVAAASLLAGALGTADHRLAGETRAAQVAADAAAAQARALSAQQQAESDLAAANHMLLQQLRDALTSGDQKTSAAILALINDNRRIHGCSTITDLAQLASAPRCTVRPPASTTSTTGPAHAGGRPGPANPSRPPPRGGPVTPITATTTTVPCAPIPREIGLCR